MQIKSKIFFLLRVSIGLLLVVSGAEKVLSPYQNFLYVIQSYEIGMPWLEQAASIFFPWIELCVGAFLVLGLWLSVTLRLAMMMFLTFVVIVGQALIRNLPLSECGCFGELIHIPPQVVLLMDSTIMAIVGIMILKLGESKHLSLDEYFEKNA